MCFNETASIMWELVCVCLIIWVCSYLCKYYHVCECANGLVCECVGVLVCVRMWVFAWMCVLDISCFWQFLQFSFYDFDTILICRFFLWVKNWRKKSWALFERCNFRSKLWSRINFKFSGHEIKIKSLDFCGKEKKVLPFKVEIIAEACIGSHSGWENSELSKFTKNLNNCKSHELSN